MMDRFWRFAASALSHLSPRNRLALLSEYVRARPEVVLEILGPRLHRSRDLDHLTMDLPIGEGPRFEHFAGLFSSTSLDHAVITLTIRQAAYLWGMVRHLSVRKAIEIGRYKGGTTMLLACAMGSGGHLWSIDNGEKEKRLACPTEGRSYDEQIQDLCRRWGLSVHLLVGDSRTTTVDTGQVDLLFIDGGHEYSIVRSDLERFGPRVRMNGAVLLDDAYDDGTFRTHHPGVRRVVDEAVASGNYRLQRTVNRMAHLERIG